MGRVDRLLVAVRWSVASIGMILVLSTIGTQPARANDAGFVQRSGGQLMVDGTPWHPIGWNNYRLPNSVGGFICDAPRGVLTDAQMQALFTRFRTESGANVVRTWFFQSYYQANPAQPWAAFDRVLANAAATGLRVIPVLTNNQADCETPASAQKSVAFYASGYQTASPTSDGYALSYLEYARSVAQHYAGNPSVAFWQLVNEIDPTGCNAANESTVATVIHDFGNTVAAALKSVDPNHLVSLGTQGSGQCGTSGTHYATVHGHSAIDMCEYHDYNEASRAMPSGNPSSSVDTGNGLQTRLNQCQSLGLPLVVGESGVLANVGSDGSASTSVTSATLTQRDHDFAAKMPAAFAAGADGYLIWEGIPEASDSSANVNDGAYGVGPSDPTEASMLATARSEGAAPAGDTPDAPVAILLPLIITPLIVIAVRRRRGRSAGMARGIASGSPRGSQHGQN